MYYIGQCISFYCTPSRFTTDENLINCSAMACQGLLTVKLFQVIGIIYTYILYI